MADIPDGSIDLIACDLPYGTTACSWDSVVPLDRLWAHYERLLKPDGAIVLTAAQPFTSTLVMSKPEWFRHPWIWEKNFVTGHLNAHRMPMRKHEDVLVFSPNQPTYNPQGLERFGQIKRRGSNGANYGVSGTENFQEFTNYPVDILRFDRDMPSVHSTQKPVALMEYLIRTYSNDGETVLDNTMGSGTTMVACVNTRRRGVGIERDPNYFAIAERRIADARLRLDRPHAPAIHLKKSRPDLTPTLFGSLEAG
jgi:site-specific DNA-methyltransferase (adenine-specific)